jgi:hypothetical protein
MPFRGLVPGTAIGRDDNLFYDLNMIHVLAKYVTLGLHPGGFGEALLLGHRHRLPGLASFREVRLDDLKNQSDAATFKLNVKQQIWENMLQWTDDNVKPEWRGQSSKDIWNWTGLGSCPKDYLMLLKLSNTSYWFLDYLFESERNWFHWDA